MLRLLQLVEQFIGIERRLEDDWGEVTLELTLADGQPVSAQLPRTEAEQLELREGDIVYVRATIGESASQPRPTTRFARPSSSPHSPAPTP